MRQRRGIEVECGQSSGGVEDAASSYSLGHEAKDATINPFIKHLSLHFLIRSDRKQAVNFLRVILLLLGMILWLRWETVGEKHRYQPIQVATDTYHVLQCPEKPTKDYPREYPILDVLRNWNPKDVKNTPKTIYQGICIFDLANAPTSDQQHLLAQRQIQAYRAAEVPFVIRNDPAVLKSVNLWNTPNYLPQKLEGMLFEATLSNTTSITYYAMNPEYNQIPDDFEALTQKAPMSFDDWMNHAQNNPSRLSHSIDSFKYAYLRLDGCLRDHDCDSTYRGSPTELDNADFIYEDLSFFGPSNSQQQRDPGPPSSSSLYDINVNKSRGIQCRFGTPGMRAANHFDNENNYIAMLSGKRRYLLGHPRNCPSMYLYPPKHPLERHTRLDWTSADESYDKAEFPAFTNTTINEVVLQAGDVLYLPTYWFHYIISLTVNYQCNTRSGYSVEYDQIIYDCGFFYDFPS